MLGVRRLSLLLGFLLAVSVCLVVLQGSFQKAWTQVSNPGGDGPSYRAPQGAQVVPGEIIVSLEERADGRDLGRLNRENAAVTEENLPNSDVNLVDLPRGLGVAEAVRAYEADPDVEYAEPNFRVFPTLTPNDPYYAGNLWGLDNTGQTIAGRAGTPDADVDAPEAWNTTTGSPNTVVGVIDEGIDINHPDLKDNIWTNPGEVAGNNVDDDRNGYVDDINGYDFANNDASVYDGAGDDHGTHVAGTIAAVGNNGVGVTGVSWDAQVVPLKFLGANGGTTLDAIEAVNYAVAAGIKISNNSWGGGGYSQALRDAIARADSAGHIFIAAAGNGGPDGRGDNTDSRPSYPASYDVPNVVSVAATDNRDALASFSNYGVRSVDLAAPGVDIASTLPGNTYGYYSGTSMATPHVAGVAALLKSQNPALDDAQMKGKLLNTVDKKSTLSKKVLSGGRLNAQKALAATTP